MKKFWEMTKYLWIGGALGVLQQFAGRADYWLFARLSRPDLLDLSGVMGGFAFWACLILLLILRNVPPKHVLRDILLLFAGMDFTYYFLYQFWNDMSPVLRFPDRYDNRYILNLLIGAGVDFLFWTIIGTAAAFWGMTAVKLRYKGKKRLYIVMLVPLYLVIAAELTEMIISVVQYFVHLGKETPGISYDCPSVPLICCAAELMICIIAFRKEYKNRPEA